MVRATAKPRAAVAGVATLPSPAAFLAPPSVLARPGSHRPWSHSTRLPSSAAARSLRLTPTRPSHAARLLPIMAEGGGEAPPAPSSPSAPADVPAAAGGVSQLTGPARARQEEKVRKALSEAERLKQLAAEARLEAERATLIAERKRLEMERSRLAKAKALAAAAAAADPSTEPGAPLPPTATTHLPATAPAEEASDANAEDPEKQSELRGVAKFPSVLAAQLEAMGVELPSVTEETIATLKDKVISMDVFFVTGVDRSLFAERVVFTGNLRTSPEEALRLLNEAVEEVGLATTIRLFILSEEAARDVGGSGGGSVIDLGRSSGTNAVRGGGNAMDIEDEPEGEFNRPCIVALPYSDKPDVSGLRPSVVAVCCLLVAAVSTGSYGISAFAASAGFADAINAGDLSVLSRTVPMSVATAAIAVVHEVSHRVVAAVRGVKLGPPFFVPSLQVGNYGSVTPFADFPPTRSHMLDVALAGPIAGFVASAACLVAGLALTASASAAGASVGVGGFGAGDSALSLFPVVPAALFRASALGGTIVNALLPGGVVGVDGLVSVHPFVLAGFTGLLANALNALPIGRLDGGRAVLAAFGRITASAVGSVSLTLLGVATVFGDSPLLLAWLLFVLFLQRDDDVPCLNEVTEPSTARTVAALVMLVVAVAVLLPMPVAVPLAAITDQL
ncbi:hypothetical protein I4F81_005997 [Pyropia yezoensis]|uniref:Uncharacterized protein n=1 Tax=Pyropia yezoensis TaxID=2788 RepID=A0ACC3C0G4_PYRYE|nr:hypothetical protein I4F81_005997 [Neopyropia yezoensis]